MLDENISTYRGLGFETTPAEQTFRSLGAGFETVVYAATPVSETT